MSDNHNIRTITDYLQVVHGKDGVLGDDIDIQQKLIASVLKSVETDVDSNNATNVEKNKLLLASLSDAQKSPDGKVLVFVDSKSTANMAVNTNQNSTEHQTVYAHVIIPRLKWIANNDERSKVPRSPDVNTKYRKLFDVTPIEDTTLKSEIINRFRKRIRFFDSLNNDLMTDCMYYVYFGDIGGPFSVNPDSSKLRDLCIKEDQNYYPPYGWSTPEKCKKHTIRSTLYNRTTDHINTFIDFRKNITTDTSEMEGTILKGDDALVTMYNNMRKYMDNNTDQMLNVMNTVMTQVMDTDPKESDEKRANTVSAISSFLTGSGVNLCHSTLGSELSRIKELMNDKTVTNPHALIEKQCSLLTGDMLDEFILKEKYKLRENAPRLVCLAIYNWSHQTCYIPKSQDCQNFICVPTVFIHDAFRALEKELDKPLDFQIGDKVYYPGLLSMCIVANMYKTKFSDIKPHPDNNIDVTHESVGRNIRRFLNQNRVNALPPKSLVQRLDKKNLTNEDMLARLKTLAMPMPDLVRVFGEKNIMQPNQPLRGCGKFRTLHFIKIDNTNTVKVFPAVRKTQSCIDRFIKMFEQKSVFDLLNILSGKRGSCKGTFCNRSVSMKAGGGGRGHGRVAYTTDAYNNNINNSLSGTDDSQSREAVAHSDTDDATSDNTDSIDESAKDTPTYHIPTPFAILDYDDHQSKRVRGKIVGAKNDTVQVWWNTTDLQTNPEWVDLSDLQME